VIGAGHIWPIASGVVAAGRFAERAAKPSRRLRKVREGDDT
jgi:hypothetical protein